MSHLVSSTRSWAIEHMSLQAFTPADHGKVYYEMAGQVLLVSIIYTGKLWLLGWVGCVKNLQLGR